MNIKTEFNCFNTETEVDEKMKEKRQQNNNLK